MKDLLICVGNMGSYANLGPCLRSVFAEPSRDFDFAVAVGFNGFSDRTVIDRMVTEFPRVTWFQRPERLGFTGVYNLLMRIADARYVLILDDDTLIPPGTLPAMLAFMDRHPSVGMSGCRTLNPDGSLQTSFGVFSTLASELEGIVRPGPLWPRRIYRNLPDWKEVDWLDGTFLLVRREALAQVGGFDAYYFTFMSEADWAMRMKRAGWRIAFVNTVSIEHIGGEHSINTRVKKYSSIVRSYVTRFYFYRQHYGVVHRLLLRPAIAMAALVRSVKFALMWLTMPNRRGEAGPKASAFARIVALAFQPRPWLLPKYLQQENQIAAEAVTASSRAIAADAPASGRLPRSARTSATSLPGSPR